ncbi:MAG: hypothetical protein V4658_15535 [Bacteroidota bacterium]
MKTGFKEIGENQVDLSEVVNAGLYHLIIEADGQAMIKNKVLILK